MSANTAADGLLYFPDEGYAEAYVDPGFAVDPKYAGDYTLEFSSGIDNQVSLVPLPAAAPMFGVALITLGGVGCGLKRRKAAAAA